MVSHEPHHHDLDGRLEVQLREEHGIVGGFDAGLDIEQLLPLRQHIRDFADPAFEFADSVVGAHAHRVLLPGPLDRHCQLLHARQIARRRPFRRRRHDPPYSNSSKHGFLSIPEF